MLKYDLDHIKKEYFYILSSDPRLSPTPLTVVHGLGFVLLFCDGEF